MSLKVSLRRIKYSHGEYFKGQIDNATLTYLIDQKLAIAIFSFVYS